MQLKVYLSGEIHTPWRQTIQEQCRQADLNVEFYSPVTDHQKSDDCGRVILGTETDAFWHDHKSAKINAIRTRNLIANSDIVIVKFGEKYRQWNAAFEAGYAAALNIPLIIIHDTEHNHALKEVDAAALAVAEKPEQVVELLKYVSED